jgi:type I restriction enzyme S subunit
VIRLGNIAIILAGQAAPTDFSMNGLPFIRAGHLEDLINGTDISQLPKVSNEVASRERLKLLPAKSILFAKSGMSATKNRVYITTTESYFVSHLAAILPSKNFDTNYLAYFLTWFKPSKLIIDEAYPSIRLSEISDLKIPLPALAEQQKIAAILDAADSLRQKDQQLVERYTALSQSLFLEMFGDPLSNPKKWKLSTLSSLVNAVIDCPHTTPRWTESGKVAIRTSNLSEGGWIWDDKRYVSEQEYHERSARAYVKSGDIVLSREGTVGIAAIVSPDMEICLGQRLVQIQPNLQLANNHFLLNLILYELAPERIERVMVGATSKHLNLRDLRNMKMITPSITLQNQFAERIQQIEAQKQQAQRSLEKSEALFNSLLQWAFTSELTAKMAA